MRAAQGLVAQPNSTSFLALDPSNVPIYDIVFRIFLLTVMAVVWREGRGGKVDISPIGI